MRYAVEPWATRNAWPAMAPGGAGGALDGAEQWMEVFSVLVPVLGPTTRLVGQGIGTGRWDASAHHAACDFTLQSAVVVPGLGVAAGICALTVVGLPAVPILGIIAGAWTAVAGFTGSVCANGRPSGRDIAALGGAVNQAQAQVCEATAAADPTTASCPPGIPTATLSAASAATDLAFRDVDIRPGKTPVGTPSAPRTMQENACRALEAIATTERSTGRRLTQVDDEQRAALEALCRPPSRIQFGAGLAGAQRLRDELALVKPASSDSGGAGLALGLSAAATLALALVRR